MRACQCHCRLPKQASSSCGARLPQHPQKADARPSRGRPHGYLARDARTFGSWPSATCLYWKEAPASTSQKRLL